MLPKTRNQQSSKPSLPATSTTSTMNSGRGSARRRFLDLLRFTAARPTSSVRFSRQRNINTCQSSSSKQQPGHQDAAHDDAIEPTTRATTTNEHVVNIIPSNDTQLPTTCDLCCNDNPPEEFERLTRCWHAYCRTCLQHYLRLEITEGRVTLNCPQSDCPERIHPCDISRILQNQPDLIAKYEQFMVRRVLQSIVDTRWCPAPDCGFAVIASGYAACPEIRCLRPGCDTSFCYHCKSTWHPNKTCEDAAREKTSRRVRSGSSIGVASVQQTDDIKQCPRCQASILKMDDGSCNHMTCPICEAEFCWLCGREISDLHYLSPSGCTFWGEKQWSRKKVILWQVATLIGAPVIIALIAGVAVPGIIIGVPIWLARKIFKKFNKSPHSKWKRNLLAALASVGGVIVSPVIAALAISIGVPILLAYVYGVIPISLCRTGGCGVGTRSDTLDADSPTIDNLLPHPLREVPIARTFFNDTQSVLTQPTIGSAGDSASLSNSVTHLVDDRSEGSTKALPGTGAVSLCESLPASNRLEVHADVSDCKSYDIESITISEKSSKTIDSLKALAGSIKDACTTTGLEYSNDPSCSAQGDLHGRKSSLLSNGSDYAPAMAHRAGSPSGDKTVSFLDERIKAQSKQDRH